MVLRAHDDVIPAVSVDVADGGTQAPSWKYSPTRNVSASACCTSPDTGPYTLHTAPEPSPPSSVPARPMTRSAYPSPSMSPPAAGTWARASPMDSPSNRAAASARETVPARGPRSRKAPVHVSSSESELETSRSPWPSPSTSPTAVRDVAMNPSPSPSVRTTSASAGERSAVTGPRNTNVWRSTSSPSPRRRATAMSERPSPSISPSPVAVHTSLNHGASARGKLGGNAARRGHPRGSVAWRGTMPHPAEGGNVARTPCRSIPPGRHRAAKPGRPTRLREASAGRSPPFGARGTTMHDRDQREHLDVRTDLTWSPGRECTAGRVDGGTPPLVLTRPGRRHPARCRPAPR